MTKPKLAEGCTYHPDTNSVSGLTLWERWGRLVDAALDDWDLFKARSTLGHDYSPDKEKIRKRLGLRQ